MDYRRKCFVEVNARLHHITAQHGVLVVSIYLPRLLLLPSFSLYCCSLERSCESSYITLICYVANPKGPATLASAPCTRPRVHRSMKYKYCTGPPNSVNKYYHPSTRGPNPNTLIGCREVVFRLVVVRHLQLYPATLAEN